MAITRKANKIFIAAVTSAAIAITLGTSAQAGPDARSHTIEYTPTQ
jgi:hypothetical protein